MTRKQHPESGRYYSPTTGALVADATATDAKREGYYPSITTLKYELAEPWNLRQSRERLIAKTAALTDDPGEFADEVSWQDEMRTDAVAEWRKAAQRGTDMHALISGYLRDGIMTDLPPVELLGVLRSITNTISEGVVFCHEYGFAGTSDCFAMYNGQPTILDFKTQGVNERPNYYAEWRMQLAGYFMGLREQGHPAFMERCMSVVINTNSLARCWRDPDHPGVFTKTYAPAKIAQAMNKIKLAAAMWYVNRGVKEELLPPGVRRMLAG